jgi:hypothetical protein
MNYYCFLCILCHNGQKKRQYDQLDSIDTIISIIPFANPPQSYSTPQSVVVTNLSLYSSHSFPAVMSMAEEKPVAQRTRSKTKLK